MMIVRLPDDLEQSIEAAVRSGRFGSVDEAMTEAAHLLVQQLEQDAKAATVETGPGLGSIGAMRDAAGELDEIVADAMRTRREEVWRHVSVE